MLYMGNSGSFYVQFLMYFDYCDKKIRNEKVCPNVLEDDLDP